MPPIDSGGTPLRFVEALDRGELDRLVGGQELGCRVAHDDLSRGDQGRHREGDEEARPVQPRRGIAAQAPGVTGRDPEASHHQGG